MVGVRWGVVGEFEGGASGDGTAVAEEVRSRLSRCRDSGLWRRVSVGETYL